MPFPLTLSSTFPSTLWSLPTHSCLYCSIEGTSWRIQLEKRLTFPAITLEKFWQSPWKKSSNPIGKTLAITLEKLSQSPWKNSCNHLGKTFAITLENSGNHFGKTLAKCRGEGLVILVQPISWIILSCCNSLYYIMYDSSFTFLIKGYLYIFSSLWGLYADQPI